MDGLILHCGAQLAPREEVFKIPVPVATPTYVPLSYESFITRIEKQLQVEGIRIKDEKLALNKEGQRMFGLMELEFPDFQNRDYACVLGLRTSYNKSFATGLVVGATAFVCDNLSFSGSVTWQRKHTANLLRDLQWIISETTAQLPAKFAAQSKAFEAYRQTELTERQAHHLIIKMYDRRAFSITELPSLLQEFRKPRHEEFAKNGKTAWTLFNAATEICKGDLWRMPARTRAIHSVLDVECGLATEDGEVPINGKDKPCEEPSPSKPSETSALAE